MGLLLVTVTAVHGMWLALYCTRPLVSTSHLPPQPRTPPPEPFFPSHRSTSCGSTEQSSHPVWCGVRTQWNARHYKFLHSKNEGQLERCWDTGITRTVGHARTGYCSRLRLWEAGVVAGSHRGEVEDIFSLFRSLADCSLKLYDNRTLPNIHMLEVNLKLTLLLKCKVIDVKAEDHHCRGVSHIFSQTISFILYNWFECVKP